MRQLRELADTDGEVGEAFSKFLDIVKRTLPAADESIADYEARCIETLCSMGSTA